ncbi:MAG: DUF2442 domain-containing protein [Lentisphaerae bacterium]|nr:DUF2442 domain-containing protein [Lentisphaerota bacterium]
MIIAEVVPEENWVLSVVSDDGRAGNFDVTPYLKDEAFEPLQNIDEFAKITNGGYFIEWQCGADLSADTLEARWQKVSRMPQAATEAMVITF